MSLIFFPPLYLNVLVSKSQMLTIFSPMMIIIRRQQISFSFLHPFFLFFFSKDFEAPIHRLETQLINEECWISFLFFFFNFFSESVLIHQPDYWKVVNQTLQFWGYESQVHLQYLSCCYWLMWPKYASHYCVSKAPLCFFIHNNYWIRTHSDFLDATVESLSNFCGD